MQGFEYQFMYTNVLVCNHKYPCISYVAQLFRLKGQNYPPYFHIQQRQVVIIFSLFLYSPLLLWVVVKLELIHFCFFLVVDLVSRHNAKRKIIIAGSNYNVRACVVARRPFGWPVTSSFEIDSWNYLVYCNLTKFFLDIFILSYLIGKYIQYLYHKMF